MSGAKCMNKSILSISNVFVFKLFVFHSIVYVILMLKFMFESFSNYLLKIYMFKCIINCLLNAKHRGNASKTKFVCI